jgi:putative transposase
MDKRISQRRITLKKRITQTCKVFEVKVNTSSLSKTSIKHLNNLFVEAKWFYNYCLNQDDINDSDTTIKQVPVKVKDLFEERKLSILGAQMKQALKTRLFGSLIALKALKKNGHKVGQLKFKNKLNSIPLKQYEVTYDIDFNKNRIRLAGLKQWLKVKGLGQLNDREIANAVLMRKPSGYYFHITTYGPKEEKIMPDTSIGIDFGCQTQLTFSNRTKVEFQIPVSNRIKLLDRKIMRKQAATGKERLDSKKKYQDQFKRRKQYEKLNNKKNDIRHKVVSAITKCFKYVCFQDENIHAWQSSNHGKKIQNSSIGGIMADLKNKSHTPIMIDKFFPSTQLCPNCGKKNKLGLNERIYKCDCGYIADRDWKSSFCIETEGLKQIPTEHRNFKAQENSASTFFNLLNKISNIKVKQVGLNECGKPTA